MAIGLRVADRALSNNSIGPDEGPGPVSPGPSLESARAPLYQPGSDAGKAGCTYL